MATNKHVLIACRHQAQNVIAITIYPDRVNLADDSGLGWLAAEELPASQADQNCPKVIREDCNIIEPSNVITCFSPVVAPPFAPLHSFLDDLQFWFVISDLVTFAIGNS